MYTFPKQMHCKGHTLLIGASRTQLSPASIPAGTEFTIIQPYGGTSFYFSDSPYLPTDLVSEGVEIPNRVMFNYVGDFSNFYYLNNAVIYFYGSR